MPVNPHAVIDWAIATGRSPLDSRQQLLADYAADPVRMLGEVLSHEPARPERPCPLLAPDQERSKISIKSGSTRRRSDLSKRRTTDRAVRAAFEKLGVDHASPEAKKAISSAVGLAQAEARKRAVQDAIKHRHRERAAQSDMGRAALRVLDFWALTPEEEAEVEAEVTRTLASVP